jgi:hypothetical protein
LNPIACFFGPYCGAGCTLSLHVQDTRIVEGTSPMDVDVTHGDLGIEGRFGSEFVHGGGPEAEPPGGESSGDRREDRRVLEASARVPGR